jgi:hypothetical protein
LRTDIQNNITTYSVSFQYTVTGPGGFFVAAGYATLAMRAPQNDRLFLTVIIAKKI